MDIKRVLDKFKSQIKAGAVLENELMKKHTTFKVGGPADILVQPASIEEIEKTLEICKTEKVPFTIIGNGSNLLVRDGGIRGVIIKIADLFSGISVSGNILKAEAGATMSRISNRALENSLGGFEFASGIPGTIGGAVTMNAGAYGGEMKDWVSLVTCIDKDGKIKQYSNSEMEFGYRKSLVQKNELLVLEVELELQKNDYKDIKAKIDDFTEKRTTKQPLHLASGGSTFKRPEGHFAGKLIEDSGLRGLRYKNVQVSEKHCGFVVNHGDSSASDVLHLIGTVKKTVYDNFKVKLETEIRIIGED